MEPLPLQESIEGMKVLMSRWKGSYYISFPCSYEQTKCNYITPRRKISDSKYYCG